MELIAPLVITMSLLVPPASKGVHWDVGEVHNQLQVTFESGVQASYRATRAPCNAVALDSTRMIFRTKKTCYLADVSRPLMVRSPWTPIERKTYKRRN